MDITKVVCNFDLSTACIGVVVAGLNSSNNIVLMKSCPIFPPKIDINKDLGFMKSKKRLPTKKDGTEYVNTYYFKGEEFVSKAEKKRRDVLVREHINKSILTQMSASMGQIIEGVKPNLINVEKNAMFNGILTIELLAKLMGTLLGIAADKGVPVNEYKVQTVRKRHSPAKLVKEFAERHSKEYIASLPDVTKAALRELMQKKYGKYGLELQTDDEGDACVVFDYWYEEVLNSKTE